PATGRGLGHRGGRLPGLPGRHARRVARPGDGPARPPALARGSGAAPATAWAVLRTDGSRGGGGATHGPGQFGRRELQQPPAQLLLPAAASRAALLAPAPVLPQPPPLPP